MAIQMDNEPELGAEPDVKVTTLISGIVQDARQLMNEQMTLFQVEIKNDLRRTLTAFVPLVLGMAIIVTALFLLGNGIVHVVNVFLELPLWGAYLAVGGTIAAVGALLILLGKSMLTSFNPLPDVALKGLKENLKWETKK